MSELADTPDLSSIYCPVCEPERDPSREILRVYHCSIHEPKRDGLDDAGMPSNMWAYPSGTAESEGVTNRLYAEFLRRPRQE